MTRRLLDTNRKPIDPKRIAVGNAIRIGTVPAGSKIELADDGSVLSFHPDGSAQRIAVRFAARGLESVTDTVPAITIAPHRDSTD